MNKTEFITLPFLVKLTCILVSLYFIFYISIVGQAVWVPLFLSFLVATLLLPLANFLENKVRIPRLITSLLAPIIFALIVVGVLYFLGLQMIQFKNDIPGFKNQITDLFHSLQVFIYEHFGIDEYQQLHYINNNAESTLKKSTSIVGQLVFSLTAILTSSAFVFLYTFFILLYRRHLLKFVVWCFKPQHKSNIKFVSSQIKSIVKQYLVGLSIQITCVTTLLFIAFSIIGINYAFLFAALCGILNLIPYIGIFSATVLASLVTLATGTPIHALWVIVSVIVVNSIDGNIITPKVIGSKVQLNSFLVFFGLIVAESLWGIAGMFLAIPLLAITKIIFDNVEGLIPFGFLLGEEQVDTPEFDALYNNKDVLPSPDQGIIQHTEIQDETTSELENKFDNKKEE
ncbi:AI-2E family transporter [Flavobacterium agricola]|uniref:AI-2E family transporter n=1 Tax=Flavobacterium agricola TaxID=2870839 RepID=A0ABY6LZT9_9FLAO|nr:AI-2E family transporter [Flavobacterium agricola]UYW00939.1 AI-2E family transporter [Flavobacterium agricola]